MARKDDDEKVTEVQQGVYPVPDIPIKELLDSIPWVASARVTCCNPDTKILIL